MYNTEWTKQLNESYINNIRNPENNEIVLTEEQLNEHFTNLAIIVESIERTFDIELTEEEIDQIDEQLQLNEFVGVLARIGWNIGKRALGKGLEVGGKKMAGTAAYRAARTQAVTKAKDATKAAQDAALKAWEKGGRKGDIPFVKDIAPEMPKRGVFGSAGEKIQKFGKKLSPTVKDEKGKTLGVFGGGVRKAGYKGAWDATKAGAKQTAQALGTLATGGIAGYTLGNLLKGPEDKDHKKKRGESSTKRGDVGEYDTDWETESGRSRPTGVRVPVREDYVEGISTFTNSIVENVYEVKLSDSIKKDIRQNIEFSILANS